MKNTPPYFVFCLILVLLSCQEQSPSHSFDAPYGGRFVNLKRAIHKEFIINDSLTYEVQYDRKTKLNTVRLTPSFDTVFQAHVAKFNQFWICSEPNPSGGYDLWGFVKDGDVISGWNEREFTSYSLQASAFKDLKKSASDSTLLAMNESYVEEKLVELISSMPAVSVEKFRGEIINEESENSESLIEQATESEKLIHAIYPVPVKNALTLELIDEGEYSCVIYNLRGKQVFEQTFVGDLVEFNLESLDNGKHILALLNSAGVVIDHESIYISH